MASSDRSFRSKNNALFKNFSQQSATLIKKADKDFGKCIDKVDAKYAIGEVTLCNYRAIRAGWDMQKQLWKSVDNTFAQINKQLRRTNRTSQPSTNSLIADLRKQNKDLRKESNAQKKLLNRQTDLITGLEQRLTKLESSNSQSAKHRKAENIISSRQRKQHLDEIELVEVGLNPVILEKQSQVQEDVLCADDILFQANSDL